MSFAITRAVLGERLQIPSSVEEACAIKEAVRGVNSTLDIEEKFDIVLANFEEYEGALLTMALSAGLFRHGEWSSQIGDLHRLNRLLVNLLATTRLYLDQVPHSLTQLFGTGHTIADAFDRMKSREYDDSLGYRTMEAMRNHTQHRRLPIHALDRNSRRRSCGDISLLEHTVRAVIHPQEYREDGSFKVSVLKELEAIGPKVDLAPLVRQFVSCLGRIQTELRVLLRPFVSEWDSAIDEAGKQFQGAGASELTGLALVSVTGDGLYDVIASIFPGPLLRRKELERKNQHIQHYEQMLVSNQPTE